jgi:hypothetical protein
VVGDVDGDSDTDMFVSNFQDHNQLFLNDGLGHFTEMMEAAPATEDNRFSQYTLMFDYDDDGDLDLYVANGVCDDQTCLGSTTWTSGATRYNTYIQYTFQSTNQLQLSEMVGQKIWESLPP